MFCLKKAPLQKYSDLLLFENVKRNLSGFPLEVPKLRITYNT